MQYLHRLLASLVGSYVYYLKPTELALCRAKVYVRGPMGIITVRCPTTGHDVSTGVVVDAKAFETINYQGHRFLCDACGEVHTWEKKDATYRPSKGLT